MKHKTQERPKPKMVRTANYNCAYYVMITAVQIIFPVIFQSSIS